MSRLPRLSGEEVVKILAGKFGFHVKGQRGSHVKLVNMLVIGKLLRLFLCIRS